MNVSWPEDPEGITNSSHLSVRGSVVPGTRVYVQGAMAQTDARGNFHAQVALSPGKQQLSLRWIDVRGASGRVSGPTVDFDPAGLRARIGPWGR
jgi:hypothetical protein